MTSGFFTPEGEPAVRLRVQSDSQERGRVEAVIDTGFNGDLTLPPDLIAALALPEATEERARYYGSSPKPFENSVAGGGWSSASDTNSTSSSGCWRALRAGRPRVSSM